ncbi:MULTISPECIES: S8/S53 family peptidase [Myroides]|nr:MULTISPECIES: S8/S53 family peptidase [Myroides]UVD80159.1 S8 family peptidase [Myroides albus]
MRIGIGILLLMTSSVFGQNTALRSEIGNKYDGEKVDLFISTLDQQHKSDSLSIVQFEDLYTAEKKTNFTHSFTSLRRIEQQQFPIYYKLGNVVARQVSGVNSLNMDSRTSNLLGNNMIVAVVDGETALAKHIEFKGDKDAWRVVLGEEQNDIYSFDKAIQKKRESARLHATHVTGTILAKGLNPKAKGMAPMANVVSFGWDNDILKITDLAKQGVLLSNHSYGIAVIDDDKRPLLPVNYFGTYNIDAHNFDRVCYLFPYFQPVIAAGNDLGVADIVNPTKNGVNLLVGYSTAKNPIVVAALDPGVPEQNFQTNFSSTGPTNDFRVKPDITADGVNIFSTAFVNPLVKGISIQDNLYTNLSGTSMATPVVTGVLSLWQQWAIEKKGFPLKAATLKAVMIQSAQKIELYDGPSYRYGWGLLNAKSGVELLNNSLSKEALVLESNLFQNREFRTTVNLNSDSEKMLFTLVWTDKEGVNKIGVNNEYYGRDLVNDLDLRVFYNGEEYLPWMLNQDFLNPKAVKGDNLVDNVEKIEIENASKGEYEIVIRHKGALVGSVQDFSLVVSNSSFNGISYNQNSITLDNSIAIWPNPAEDYCYIEIDQAYVFDKHTVELYSINGQLLKEQEIVGSNRAIINVSDLPKGIYLVYVEIGGERYRKKLIKK